MSIEAIDFTKYDVMYDDVLPKLIRSKNPKRLRRWQVKTGTFLALSRKDALQHAQLYFQDSTLVLFDVVSAVLAEQTGAKLV
jgi:hypothetical protein